VQLDRIAIRILDLHLLAARANLDVIAKDNVRRPELLDVTGEILEIDHDPVPSARLLAPGRPGKAERRGCCIVEIA